MVLNKADHYEFDNLDLQILSILSTDAKMPYTEIGKKLFVSGGTVHVRMRKMEEAGVVYGSQLNIDYTKLGYDITAFLGIYLKSSNLYMKAVEDLKNITEIVGVHYTTGNYSLFVKILCKDTNHLREILHDKIQQIDGIQRTETFISLEEPINRPIMLDE